MAGEEKIAQVSVVLGSTLNMGNYESLKVQVGLTFPCKATQAAVNKTFENAFKTVNRQLAKRVKSMTGRG